MGDHPDDLVRGLEGITMNLKLNLDIIADMIPWIMCWPPAAGAAMGARLCRCVWPACAPELLEATPGRCGDRRRRRGLYRTGITRDMVVLRARMGRRGRLHL